MHWAQERRAVLLVMQPRPAAAASHLLLLLQRRAGEGAVRLHRLTRFSGTCGTGRKSRQRPGWHMQQGVWLHNQAISAFSRFCVRYLNTPHALHQRTDKPSHAEPITTLLLH
jgi:hypothetical protein